MDGVVHIDEEIIAASEDPVQLAGEAPDDAPRDADDSTEYVGEEPSDSVEDPAEESADGDVDAFIEGPVPLGHRRPLPRHPRSMCHRLWRQLNICFCFLLLFQYLF